MSNRNLITSQTCQCISKLFRENTDEINIAHQRKTSPDSKKAPTTSQAPLTHIPPCIQLSGPSEIPTPGALPGLTIAEISRSSSSSGAHLWHPNRVFPLAKLHHVRRTPIYTSTDAYTCIYVCAALLRPDTMARALAHACARKYAIGFPMDSRK